MYLSKPNGDFKDPPEGTHPARCWRVIDLGTQEVDYQGQIKHQRKVLISWELQCEERMDDGRPFTIGKKYTLSGHEKAALRKDLESWRGKKFEDADFGPGGFNIKNVIEAPCLVSLALNQSNGKSYTNVVGVMKVIKGMEVKPLENPPVFVSLERDQWKPEVFNTLSDSLKDIIRKSPEFAALHDEPVMDRGEAMRRDDLDQDIPF